MNVQEINVIKYEKRERWERKAEQLEVQTAIGDYNFIFCKLIFHERKGKIKKNRKGGERCLISEEVLGLF